MIVQTVNEYAFRDAFQRFKRQNQFSYAGLRALHEHLESMSEDMEEPIELDVVALCCEFCEYSDAISATNDYSDSFQREHPIGSIDESDVADVSLNWLRDQTIVIEFDGGIIISAF